MSKKYFCGPHRLTLLCVGSLLLSGCSFFNVETPFVADQRPKQMVEGARRMPVLNPGAAVGAPAPRMVEIQPIVPAQPPVQARSANAKEASKASTPYDQYDDKGNEVGGRNYIKEWIGDKKEAAPQSSGAADSGVRKAFAGNPSVAKETASVAPIAPAPASVTAPISAAAPMRVLSVEPAAIVPEKIAPQVTKEIPAATSENIMLPLTDAFEEDEGNGVMIPQSQETAPVPAASSAVVPAPAPVPQKLLVQSTPPQPSPKPNTTLSAPKAAKEDLHLSSVPLVPKQFEGVKATKDQKLQELQSEQEDAQEQKKSLGAEPTGLTTPEAAPTEETVVTEPMSHIVTVTLPARSWRHEPLNKAGQ